ncbi:baseplate assembly protein [Pseudomonas citronellolis]|uniref:baseplate assembly protein n=1 Tax=Pseudomonas citronellolis TaxID=53408 RepID=UPI0007185488|nr:baseplate J/gp47 family protein [Pseudomonas citronellolis]KRV80433.1 baseplate assembly protein [Pseudomonas citronellolis]KRW72247.1 baseplate assembly protein [Pseudomonas citronellolis]
MSIIDLSQLPPPDVVESLDFESLYQELLEAFRAAMGEDWDAALESDPVVKLLELAAYRELLLRARINDAARAVMLAYATGSDLEQLAAGYNVARLVIQPADPSAVPPLEAVLESDDSLRNRTQLAFDQLSVAGPRNAYVAFALGADGRIADVSAISPAPCEALISVLSREGDGSAAEDILEAVRLALSDEDVRPVGDRVTVQSASIVDYRVEAVLYIYPGPEAELIRQAAEASLQGYIATQRRLGRDIRRSALFAALHVEGVQRVELAQPAADVVLDATQAAYCTGYAISVGGSDE